MRVVWNFIIDVLIFGFASHFFPQTVKISNFNTLLLTVILIWFVSIIVEAFGWFIATIGVSFAGLSAGCSGAILILFPNIIAISILSNHLAGFMVVGFLPKILLSACCSVLHFSKD